MSETPMETTCLKCGVSRPMTIAEAIEHDKTCKGKK